MHDESIKTVIKGPTTKRDPRRPRSHQSSEYAGVSMPPTASVIMIVPPPLSMAPSCDPHHEMGYTIWGSPFIDESMHTVIVSVLVALIVVLTITLIVLLLPLFRRSLRRRAANDKRRIKKRNETINAWLITKDVQEHDNDQCPDQSALVDRGEHDEDDENLGKECTICMEEFCVGTQVAWSPKEHCRHVYHKACIQEWLVFHSDCPYCRRTMLPIDLGPGQRVTLSQLREMADKRLKRCRETSYCLEHGLVEHKVITPCRTVSMKSSSNDDSESGGDEGNSKAKKNDDNESSADVLEAESEKSFLEKMGTEPPLSLPSIDTGDNVDPTPLPQDQALSPV